MFSNNKQNIITPAKQKGFTLIELLVVISIIGLLASIVVVSIDSAKKQSRDTRKYADLITLQKALELYYQNNGQSPIVWLPLPHSQTTGSTLAEWRTTFKNFLVPEYLQDVPTAPQGAYLYLTVLPNEGLTIPMRNPTRNICLKAGSYLIGARFEQTTNANINTGGWSIGGNGFNLQPNFVLTGGTVIDPLPVGTSCP
jgi:prepilin-type N-terminal cleavage/methylation domain-containing protein